MESRDNRDEIIDRFAIHPEGGWGRGLSAGNVSVINQDISCDVLMVHILHFHLRTRFINMAKCCHPAQVTKHYIT